jgi:hypothetical protein
VGEIKAIEPADHESKLQVRHQPGHPCFLTGELHRKLIKQFATELELWQMAEAGDVRLVRRCSRAAVCARS